MDALSIALVIALTSALLLLGLIFKLWRKALSDLRESRFSTQSLSSKYGKMTEQFMPFVSDYPWDPARFRFIGSPIDGIQFEDDRVILVEFKSATSRLTAKQRTIRDQVREGRVEFEEFRLE